MLDLGTSISAHAIRITGAAGQASCVETTTTTLSSNLIYTGAFTILPNLPMLRRGADPAQGILFAGQNPAPSPIGQGKMAILHEPPGGVQEPMPGGKHAPGGKVIGKVPATQQQVTVPTSSHKKGTSGLSSPTTPSKPKTAETTTPTGKSSHAGVPLPSEHSSKSTTTTSPIQSRKTSQTSLTSASISSGAPSVVKTSTAYPQSHQSSSVSSPPVPERPSAHTTLASTHLTTVCQVLTVTGMSPFTVPELSIGPNGTATEYGGIAGLASELTAGVGSYLCSVIGGCGTTGGLATATASTSDSSPGASPTGPKAGNGAMSIRPSAVLVSIMTAILSTMLLY